MKFRSRQCFIILLAVLMLITTSPMTALAGSAAEPAGNVTAAIEQAGADVPVPIADSGILAGVDWTLDGTTLTLTVPKGVSELNANLLADDGDKKLSNIRSSVTKVIVQGDVVSLSPGCFRFWTGLQSVELPAGLTTIGESAFSGCSALTFIELPASLTTIGTYAFSNCSALTFIELPAGLTSIENHTFDGCSALTFIELPAGLTTIGDYAFSGCSSLALAELPAGLTTIGWTAFSGCSSLALTELPESVTTIGGSAFYNCERLALRSLPAGLTSIESSTFRYCSALTFIELPAGLKTIGAYAFSDCRRLSLTELPEGVTTIGERAFMFCYNITHLTLPASLASMGQYVFRFCSNLTSLTFTGMNAPSIDPFTFVDAGKLQRIYVPEGATGYDANGWPQDKIKVGHAVTVDVSDPDGGTASAAPAFAAEGDAVVLTAAPKVGYHLARWETTPELTVAEDGSFTMPDEDVTVTAVFAPHTYENGVCSTCGDSYECDIFVKTTSGSHTELHVKSTDTVHSVKERLAELEGIPAGVLQLTFNSRTLENDKCLGDYGIIKDSTLHLIIRYAPEGEGTEDEPFMIPDAEQLEAFQYYINDMYASSNGGEGKCFKLTADVDLEDVPWTPIAYDSGHAFQGTFDGDGHTIRGLYIERNSESCAGLFGAVSGGTVKNVTVEGSLLLDNVSYSGGIAGRMTGGTIENCTSAVTISCNRCDRAGGIVGESERSGAIRSCVNTGDIDTDGQAHCVGGIVGYTGSPVENCRNEGTIGKDYTADEHLDLYYVGGIAGQINLHGEEQLKNCVNTGAVFGCNYVGGIVGDCMGDVADSQNSGPVSGNSYVGGIAGSTSNKIQNCGNAGAVTGRPYFGNDADRVGGIAGANGSVIANCYNTGAVGEAINAGGIAGENYSGRTVENCYNTAAISGVQNAGGIVGRNAYYVSGFGDPAGTVKHCYSVGAVTCEAGRAGSVVGLNEDGAVVENCYYLDNSRTADYGTAMGSLEFASGQVTYLLQKGQSEPVWGQRIGSDELPLLTGDPQKTVHRITFASEEEAEYAVAYANAGGLASLPEAPQKAGYTFVKWALTDAPDGTRFTTSTVVDRDMTVYAVFKENSSDVPPGGTPGGLSGNDPGSAPSGPVGTMGSTGGLNSGSAGAAKDHAPGTGDPNDVALWLAFLLVSLLSIAWIVRGPADRDKPDHPDGKGRKE